MEVLLESGARITEIDNDGRIPLSLAAQEGHITVVASLLEAGSPIESKAHDGKTPIRVAALEGHKDVVHFLLCEGADLNYRDADGRSTLYMLALENHLAMATFLLENGADVESCDLEGRTALHVAAWQGHTDMVELLINHGAQVNAVDNDQRTALQSAAWQGHHTIVQLLLERGANVDHTCNQGATALCIAAQEGHEQVVQVLLKFKANPNHADQYGRSATRVALKGGHQNVVKLLEDNGALPINGVNQRRSGGASGNTLDLKPPPAQPVYANINIPNGHRKSNGSPSESPGSTYDKRKSNVSNKSSGNLSASNTSSTNQSSSSAQDGVESPGMSFTQQLQQSAANKNRNRPMSRVLSPVSEPQSPSHSPPGSPLSEIPSMATRITPELLSPVSTKPNSPLKGYSSSKHMHIISNPTTEPSTTNGAKAAAPPEEPVWQRISDVNCHASMNAAKMEIGRKDPYGGAMPMGQAALSMKSPEARKKRNGIVTNPNYAKNVSINGYFNKLSNLPDPMDNYTVTNGNSSGSGPQKRAQRPNGLPIKKETPLWCGSLR